MKSFETIHGKIATLDRANVDTDQIIPKQFLKSIKRTGFGENLFFDWRYRSDGSPNPDFSLNQPQFQGVTILVTRNNFGCGSSREHAVWAIQQYGFQAVIAPWQMRGNLKVPAFADIFRNNCVKNSLLTIELSEPQVSQIFEMVERHSSLSATIQLEGQKVALDCEEETSFSFEINPGVKERLLNGLDDIGITLQHEDAIRRFEKQYDPKLFCVDKSH